LQRGFLHRSSPCLNGTPVPKLLRSDSSQTRDGVAFLAMVVDVVVFGCAETELNGEVASRVLVDT